MIHSLLSRISADQVVREPFPHVVVENALEDDVARQLMLQFPVQPLSEMARGTGPNRKVYLTAARAFQQRLFADVWMDAVRAHVQPSEWREALRIFRPHLSAEFPGLRDLLGGLDDLRVGIRAFDRFSEVDVLLDCKAVMHTPVRGAPVVERGPHLKSFRTVIVWYLYLRADDDRSTGADHVLYRLKPGADVVLHERQTLDPSQVEAEVVIPYRQNTFVMYINTPRSFQTNAPRTAGDVPLMALHGSIYLRERAFAVAMKPGVLPIEYQPRAEPPVQRAGWLRALLRAHARSS